MEPEELKNSITVLRELGLSYEETIKLTRGVTEDLRSTKSLWRGSGKSKLIKMRARALVKRCASLGSWEVRFSLMLSLRL